MRIVTAEGEMTRSNSIVRMAAHVISVVFHPLFIATYVTAFLLYVHPYVFSGFPEGLKFFRLVSVIFNTAFVPLFAVFLMWRLKLVESMMLKTQKDRIIPLIIATIFYFWIMYVSNNLPENPEIFSIFLKGSFIAVCVAWFFNIFFKISMHAVAIGAALTFFIYFSFTDSEPSGLYLAIVVLITGLVLTARMIVSDHTPGDIYVGLFFGALAQFVGFYV